MMGFAVAYCLEVIAFAFWTIWNEVERDADEVKSRKSGRN
jgi:hypothetical protein